MKLAPKLMEGRGETCLLLASVLALTWLPVLLQLGAPIALAQAYCDKTFLSTGSASGESASPAPAPQPFVAPNGVKAKLYAIYKTQQGNLVASRNLTRVGQPQDSSHDSTSKPDSSATNSSSSSGGGGGGGGVSNNTESYGNGNSSGQAFHCLYRFIGQPGERVAVSFSSFKLRGEEPECNREYVDIYMGLKSEERFEEAISKQQAADGRFCTTLVPHKLVSLHNMLVLSIYSDLEPPADGKPLFSGSYEFIKSSGVSEQNIGAPEEGTLCTHTIRSSSKREGEFQSVTYPGVYLKNLRCAYKLIGEPNQRIRLEFLDLDLFSGGSHCPFDSIKIFDGLEESEPLIQTICGSHRSLIIYSTHERLLVTFNTLQREVEIQDRGFSAYFEFSDKFYNPNFIEGPNARHIRGTECDQRIVSTKGSTGFIVSPEFKRDHPNAICRYFFEALQSAHDYEKVLLKFTDFDLKTPSLDAPTPTSAWPSFATLSATTTTTTTTSSPLSPFIFLNQSLSLSNLNEANSSSSSSSSSGTGSGNGTTPEQCPDNYVRIYTGEQKPEQKQDPNDYDYVFCTNELPTTIESDAASMLMEYNSGSIGGSFRAEYNFIVDYRIPGYQASTGCNYIYRSDLLKTGTFNSPRHPSWYLNNMNCSYTFLTNADEALLLQFTTVKMAKSFADSIVGMNGNCTGEDAIEIDEITLEANDSKVIDQYQIGTYCGTTRPGPILSFRPVQVHFRATEDKAHYGFSAIYHFHSLAELKTNEFVSNCGGQIHANHRQRTGTISSPATYRSDTYEKRNHICSWNITARPSHRIALDFNQFELEGTPAVRGCATASVRIELGKSRLPEELCGPMIFPSLNASVHQFLSENEWLVVTFISTKQASGSNGFTATWTEIKRAG